MNDGLSRRRVLGVLAGSVLATGSVRSVAAAPSSGTSVLDGPVVDVVAGGGGLARGDDLPFRGVDVYRNELSIGTRSASLNRPTGLSVSGNDLLVADSGNHLIRRMHPDGRMTIELGCGITGVNADYSICEVGDRKDLRLSSPSHAIALPDGSLAVADDAAHRLLRCDETSVSTMIDSTADSKFSALFGTVGPGHLVLRDGTLFFSDCATASVYRYDGPGEGQRVLGAGHIGDGPTVHDRASAAAIGAPSGLCVLPGGTILVADSRNGVIWEVDPELDRVSRWAGQGSQWASGEGVHRLDASFCAFGFLSCASDGSVVVSDWGARCVREIAPDGTTSTVAMTGPDDPDRRDAALAGPRTALLKWDPCAAVRWNGGLAISSYSDNVIGWIAS